MANLKDKIEVELEHIEQVLNEIPQEIPLHQLSTLELAGVATLLHNFYNGIENIIKQILKYKTVSIPQSASWHKEMLNAAELYSIILPSTKITLAEYLAFRHFFSHAYALDLYPQKMEPLVKNIADVLNLVKEDIKEYLNVQ